MNKKKRQVQPLSPNSTISVSAGPLKDRLKHPYWEKRLDGGLGALIAVITFLVYLPSLQNGFVNWDDNLYVFENLNIRSIDLNFIKWSLTAVVASLWHPLTLLSLALDYAIWGLNPSGYHLTNILLHSLNTFLVFILTVRLSNGQKGLFTGIVTALLFGIHPLHVESVAWISERKDVLCAFFFLLSLLSYAKYASEKSRRSYVFSLSFFILALMSKPMAVTLPIVLLIVDYYPFKRLTIEGGFKEARGVFFEKVPFILFSLILSAITIWAHEVGGGLSAIEQHPLSARLLIAGHAYVFYLLKMLLPDNLVPFYPLPEKINLFSFEYSGALVILTIVTFLAIWFLKKNNAFSSVWFYYLITLFPAIGIIQVGGQAAADRYTYLPSLGPFLLTGVAIGYVFERYSNRNIWVALAAGLIFLTGLLSYKTIDQIAIWRDSMTLWSHQINFFPVEIAYNNRGIEYNKLGNYKEAIIDFAKTIALNPQSVNAYNNRGLSYYGLGNYRQAIKNYDMALMIDPTYVTSYINRGMAYNKLGDFTQAIVDFTKAIDVNPQSATAYNNRGLAYYNIGEYQQAINDFSSAIRCSPLYADAYINRSETYDRIGEHKLAMNDFNRAKELQPENLGFVYYNRGLDNYRIGKQIQAIEDFSKALQIEPEYAEAYIGRGTAFYNLGKYQEALNDYQKAIDLNPTNASAYFNLGLLYTDIGDSKQAQILFKRASELGLKKAQDFLRDESAVRKPPFNRPPNAK